MTEEEYARDRKVCPLRSLKEDRYCLLERCEWYVDDFGYCAIVDLKNSLAELLAKLSALKDTIKELKDEW